MTAHSSAAPAPAIAGPGHNNPPASIADQLADSHEALIAGIEVLARQANDAPKDIADDEVLGRIADIGRAANDLWNHADKARETAKAPYLKGCRDVDGFFKPLLDRLSRIHQAMRARAQAYNDAKLAAQRAAQLAAEAEARRRAEEARQAAEQAAAAGRVDDAMAEVEAASKAESAAEQAAEAAAVKPADVVRTRSDGGTTVTARAEWTHEIVDFDAIPLDKLRPYLKRDAIDAALKLFVRQGNRELPGVRIFEKANTQFRR